ncbi:hypothetical protein AB1Y20_014569 [Prymnesium parvum]|uniref:glutathione dehydrogenase (ascorbate) n=1 Tax=Prymnesium parvum TaxID=97485 RepID=A0AB34IDT4_PRYPA
MLAVLAQMASASLLTLHVKAGPDGRAVGDCPFAHALRIALEHKELEYRLAPHAPHEKPEWLVADYGGAMPCLQDGEAVVTESSTIMDHLEERYPSPSLSPAGLDAAEAVRSPVFGSFARYCKNVDEAADAELKKALLLSLCNLDAHLQQHAAPFAAGATLSRCDCFLLPALYHIKVAGAAFKQFEIPEQFTALTAYVDKMFESDLLYRTAPPPPMVRWGWASARGDTHAADEAIAELNGA